MQKAHSNINWENLPSKNTPLGAYLLNKQDREIDVIDDRVLSLYGYESRAAESEKNAKESAVNAKTSEENAKQSELLAKEYADRAFIATPEGYQKVLDDVESNKESIDSLEQSVNSKLESNGDISDTTVSFNSTDESNPTSYTDVPLLKSGEKSSSILSKISTMFKNMRYFLKILGNTDISKIGDGTATGAISSINDDLNNKIQILDIPNANCEFRFPTNEAGTSYYYLNLQPSAMTYAHHDPIYGRTHYWTYEPPKWKKYGTAIGDENVGIPISTEILVEITFEGNSYTVLIPTHFLTSNEKAYTFGHYYNSTENVYGYVSATTERMRVIVFKNMVEVSSSASINIYYR